MGSRKGEKVALQREMAAAGEFAPKLPARVGPKPRIPATVELLREACERFSKGETLTAICRDVHMPDRTCLWRFTLTDPQHEQLWATAKAMHAEHLMEAILGIADADVKGPDGRVDSGQVQRDRLRVDVRHLRAAALDPSRWGRKTEQVIVGDEARPVALRTTLAPIEVMLGIRALLGANEKAMGLLTDESRSERERLADIQAAKKPMTPALYAALNEDDDQ